MPVLLIPELLLLCLRAPSLNDAVDRQPKHEDCCDPGTIRHQCRIGLLLSDPSEGPNQDEDVAAVPTCDRHEYAKQARHNQHDDRPSLRRDPESIPINEVKIIGDIGYCGNGDPAEVDAEGNIHAPFFGIAHGCAPNVEFEITGDQQAEQGQHDQYAQTEQVVMPAEEPGRVEDAAQRK